MAWSRVSERCVHCGSAEHEHCARGLCVVCYKLWLKERFEVPEIAKRWSRNHDCCVECGTTERPHTSRGLCRTCYQAATAARHRPDWVCDGPRGLPQALTKERLEDLYVRQGLSLADIAKLFNCTRQNILRYMKRLGIDRRSMQESRVLAITQGKVGYETNDDDGSTTSRVLQRRTVDSDFFKTWSRAMAWVLGVVCTDGNLYEGRPRTNTHAGATPRLSIGQKDPELLYKVAQLMKCDVPLAHSKGRGMRGELYHLSIGDPTIYRDLLALGITPRKSKTLSFPRVPKAYLRDFIRGCWDGDGTVYTDDRGRGCASFGSASAAFLDAMVAKLCQLGMPMPTVHTESRSPSYRYFRYFGRNCIRLFHLFYDNTESEMCLHRKYLRFKTIAYSEPELLTP